MAWKYLGCGVPVLLTDVPWNAGEIEEEGCGRIITEDLCSIADNIVSLMDCSVNQIFRDKAKEYAKIFDYEEIFNIGKLI